MLNVNRIEKLDFLQNLSQRLYEYVDAVLNIVLLVLHHTDPDTIFDRFECERNERQFLDYLTIEQKRSLQQSLIGSEELIAELNQIIENPSKFYPFCTVKAYTVLSELNLDSVSENELIDAIEKRTINQIDEVKASIVKYTGSHLSKFFEAMSEANIVSTLTKLREMASPDGNDELRSSVSSVVSNIRRKWSSVTSVLLFGDIVLLLLRDECSDIRETMSRAVQQLRCEHLDFDGIMLSSLAEEQFIDWLDEQFRLLNASNPWTVWMQLIQMQLDKNLTENDDSNDEVFDKSEANVFGEVVFVCKKLMEYLHRSLTGSDLSETFVNETMQSIRSDFPELERI